MEGSRFQHKKSLGQHFLNSPVVPRWMCDAADIRSGEPVLEIGPGSGVLTRELLLRGAIVTALEADERAVAVLEETFPEEIQTNQLKIFHQDARSFNPPDFGLKAGSYKCVSNIPYYISGLLFRHLLEGEHQPNTLVFLVQKEVAERIVRDPKESLLSLSVKVFGDPFYIKTVSAGHFTPPPAVSSAIIKIENISKENFVALDQDFFFEVLHLGFAAKRKQLLGNLAKHYEREQLVHTFSTLGIDMKTRGEDLSLNIWLALAISLKKHSLST